MGVIRLKIDCSKIDKSKLFKGKDGAVYLDATILVKDNGEVSQYGQCGMIVQDVTKEERAAGKQGAILGNASPQKDHSVYVTPANAKKPTTTNATEAEVIGSDDDLPF